MNISPMFPSSYQNEPEKVNSAINYLELKATDAKKTVEELLYMLDMQEKVPWADMLEKFSSLAAAMSQLQGALKKSAIPSGQEDNGSMLKSHVLVPQRLQLEVDPQLQMMTNYRVNSWNHDVVPDYLRTKLNPEMEAEEAAIEQDRNQKGQDMINKQITNLNKHVELLLQGLHSSDRTHVENYAEKPTHSKDETVRLVRAIVCGDGLRMTPVSRPVAPPGGVLPQQGMPMQRQTGPISRP